MHLAKTAEHITEQTESSCPVVFECNSPYSFAYFQKEDKRYPMQSLRDPEREAKRLVSHWIGERETEPVLYVILGVTSMHLVTEFLSGIDENSELVLVEPSQPVAEAFVENNDLEILRNYKANFTLLSPQEGVLSKEFRKLINSKHPFCKGIYISPANQRFRGYLSDIKDKLACQVRLEALDRATTAKFADEWLQNCLINLPEIVKAPGVQILQNSFRQSDCIIACAGPSLNDSIELIKKKQDDCFVISVGTALKPLIKAGINPDITIVVDSDPKVYKQFSKLENLPGYLLATHTIFPAIYQHFSDRIICFNSLASSTFTNWISSCGLNHGVLNVGGTVALSAIDCAFRCQFRNTFIFGLDLAYADDGTSHAENSMYQGRKTISGLIEIPGNWNKKVKTTKQFANYVEILNTYLQENISGYGGKIYNVNNSGAHISKLDVIRPEEAEALILSANEDFKTILKDKFQNNNDIQFDKLCSESIHELKQIKEKCQNYLEELQQGKFPDGLESFEEYLKESSVNINLTGPALQAWCMNLNSQHNEDPIEMTKNFLSQLAGATEWVEGLLSNSYKRFLNTNKGVL